MSCQCKVCYCSSVQSGNKFTQNTTDSSSNLIKKVKFESDGWSNSVQIYPFNIDLVPKIIRKRSKCIECNQDASVNYLDSNKVLISSNPIKNNQTKSIPIIIRELVTCKHPFQNNFQTQTQTYPQAQIQSQQLTQIGSQPVQSQYQAQTQTKSQIQVQPLTKLQNSLQPQSQLQSQCQVKAQNHIQCNQKPNLVSQTPYETGKII